MMYFFVPAFRLCTDLLYFPPLSPYLSSLISPVPSKSSSPPLLVIQSQLLSWFSLFFFLLFYHLYGVPKFLVLSSSQSLFHLTSLSLCPQPHSWASVASHRATFFILTCSLLLLWLLTDPTQLQRHYLSWYESKLLASRTQAWKRTRSSCF